MSTTEKCKIKYNHNEANILKQAQEHIDKTYGAHYRSSSDLSDGTDQLAHRVKVRGDGTTVFRFNIEKYLERFGKKGDLQDARTDIYKVIHYACMLLDSYEHELSNLTKKK